MAELIPFTIAETLLMKLGSTDFHEMGIMYGFGKELRKVETALSTIKGVLRDAEERQENYHAVVAWVRAFKDVVYDADDLLDEFAAHHLRRTADMQGGIGKQISYFFSSSNQLLFRYKILRGMKNIAERVDAIVRDIPLLDLIRRDRTHQLEENRQRETHSFGSDVIGTEEVNSKIVNFLSQSSKEENLSIAAIVGTGGIGKTTVAQLVYNNEWVVKYFDLRMWVHLSADFDAKILVRNLIRSATGIDVENLNLDQLQHRLDQELNQKRYLLVMDDFGIENLEKWDQFRTLLSIGSNGSKIVITTRNREVLPVMGVNYAYELGGLADYESWALFSKLAFRDEERFHPNLIPIGEEIVKMCNGVPLIIEILGAMLRFKTQESEWFFIRDNGHLISFGQTGNLLPVLKIGYDSLPEELKQCFSYCSLFPKHYEFEKKLLVKLWMAQGYIHTFHENEDLEDIGDRYFDALLSRALFQMVHIGAYDTVVSCKMHDLIHDLALSIAKSEVCILTNDVNNISERAHHLLLVQPLNLDVVKVLKGKSLRSLFLLSDNDYKDDAIAKSIISSCRGLRVLHLNGLIHRKVPESIGKLIQLRYLDLSDSDFEVLPSAITMLQNLQTLRLLRCGKLKELPRDIEKLLNLRHLEIQGCENLTHMPSGLGRLSMLQSLPLFIVGNDIASHGMLSELKRLDHLRGELRIKNLERLKGHMALESKEANLYEKASLQSLELEWQDQWHPNAEEVMEGLLPHSNLKELNIKRYGGERFPGWMMGIDLGLLLPKLVRIEMRNCERCKVLPPFGLLPSLKYLKLEDLSVMEYMLDSSPAIPFFPSLEILRLHRLRNVKGWSKDITAGQGPSFSCLSELVVSYCHNLTSLPLHSSPHLSQLDMNHCDNFTSLLLPSSYSLSKLDIKDCPNLTSLELPSSSWLPKLHVSGHRFLKSLALPSSPYLSELYITGCASLTSLELNPCPHLSKLHIYDCPNLTISKLPSFRCLEEMFLSYVNEELVQRLMCTSAALKSLKIQWVVNLILLPELQHLTSLQHLVIHGCHNLMSLSHQVTLHLTALEKLEIIQCRGLSLSDKEDDADDGLQFQELRNLHELVIKGIPNLVSLPKQLQHVTTLNTLAISDCSGMQTLPNWIGSLISLTQLQISGCPELKSLPEEMHLLRSLQKFKINNCPQLSRRCQKETGEDWLKIHHVPEILLDGKRITST